MNKEELNQLVKNELANCFNNGIAKVIGFKGDKEAINRLLNVNIDTTIKMEGIDVTDTDPNDSSSYKIGDTYEKPVKTEITQQFKDFENALGMKLDNPYNNVARLHAIYNNVVKYKNVDDALQYLKNEKYKIEKSQKEDKIAASMTNVPFFSPPTYNESSKLILDTLNNLIEKISPSKKMGLSQ